MSTAITAPAPDNRPAARRSPDWVQRGVMYQIHLRAFTPEGTLAAATRRLPALAGLGVDVLYLCPICRQDDDPRREFWSPRQRRQSPPNPLNPYRIKDYFAIDGEYGDAEDLRTFVAEAHRLGLRVLLDVVFLHCGPGAVFLAAHPDFVQRGADGGIRHGDWGFPLLDLANPELREYLHANLAYWAAAFDLDGFRCDVSDGIPLDFWEEARRRLERLRPELAMVGEGERAEDQLQAMDLSYSFTWTYALHRTLNQRTPASRLRELWQRLAAERPAGARFLRYIDNHDLAHNASQGLVRAEVRDDESWRHLVEHDGLPAGGLQPGQRPDRIWGPAAVDALLALCFALDGMPFLYNGQEVGDVAPHSIFARMPVEWSAGDAPAGRRRYALCQRLCALRHERRCLTDGGLRWLDHDRPDEVLAFVRESAGERCLVLVNLSSTVVEAVLAEPAGALQALLAAGAEADAAGSRVRLAPSAYLIARCG